MDDSPIVIRRDGRTTPLGYDLVCSGYLVSSGCVLLVHHNGFDKWVPPGGHIEGSETFAEAACREFLEETGLTVEPVTASAFSYRDDNAVPEPTPFYVDVLVEGFPRPALTQYFYVRLKGQPSELLAQLEEVHEVRWVAPEELTTLRTFDQVRALANYALTHHPDSLNQFGDTRQT